MTEMKKCALIIQDDFGNVLTIAKGKKSDPIVWQCLGRKKKGKESDERCISNIAKEDLNTLLFDIERVKDFIIEDESISLFKAKIKEYMNLGKKVKGIEWINENTINDYNFLPNEKEIYLEFFK